MLYINHTLVILIYAPLVMKFLTAIFILFSTWLLIIIITSTSDLQPSSYSHFKSITWQISFKQI